MKRLPPPVYVFEDDAVELIWIRTDGSIITLETRTCPPPSVVAARADGVRAELKKRGWETTIDA